MTISFIYKYGTNGFNDIEKTYAYQKIDTDKFLMVSVTRSYEDKNDKRIARTFAKAKIQTVIEMLDKTGGKLKPKGKMFYRYISFDQLKELKQKILWQNDIVKNIRSLCAALKKGYKAFTKKNSEVPQ